MKDDLKIDKTIMAMIVQNKPFAMEVSGKISFEYFHPKVQWAYKSVMDHFNNPKFKEIPTVNVVEEYLKKHYTQKEFISNCINMYQSFIGMEVDKTEFTWYLDKLKNRYNEQVQRVCVKEVVSILKEVSDADERVEKVNDIIKKSVSVIDSIHKKEAYHEGSLDESAIDRANRYKAVEANPELAQGILTGIDDFDRVTNGMHPGELILIGGRSSTGKSIMMHNIAVNAWLGGYDPLGDIPNPEDVKTGHNVLYFSIEMPKSDQEARLDSCLAGVDFMDLLKGNLSLEDKEKFFRVLKFQKKFANKFHIVDMARGVTVRDIELKKAELEDKLGVEFKLVVADYLGIMKPNNGEKQESDWREQGVVSEEAHEFARACMGTFLSAVQLNRPKDAKNEERSINRVSRSDMIPQNANIILQIACREEEESRLDMPVYFTKNRNGPKTSFVLIKDFANMRVKNMDGETFGEGDDDEDEMV